MNQPLDVERFPQLAEAEIERREREELRPTMKLRWKETSDWVGKIVAECRDYSTDYFTLQQWWENKLGQGEWREVDSE